MSVQILIGDCREKLRDLPDASVNCCVTSPPYFGLRDYGHEGQMGLEPTPDEFVAGMVEVFREVRRVLRDDGTLWLNIGDSYASVAGGYSETGSRGASSVIGAKTQAAVRKGACRTPPAGTKAKDLIGIPWMLAFALRADGWYLRQDIIWSKKNPMPESVQDRCTKAHEYLFLLSKGPRYYYDQEAILEAGADASLARLQQNLAEQAGSERVPGKTNGTMKAVRRPVAQHKQAALGQNLGGSLGSNDEPLFRNKRSVWEVATQPFSEAHFATYPPALIEPCILAGCPERACGKCGAPWMREVERTPMVLDRSERTHEKGRTRASGTMLEPPTSKTIGFAPSCACHDGVARGTVLDPFGGAGTTGLVADRLQRDAILVELNPEYAEIAHRRLNAEGGMFADVKVAA